MAVDDHPVNQIFIKKLLIRLGFTNIDLAENGKEALEMIMKNKYDIVLMDCQMPEIDGYQTTTMLREMEKGTAQHLPVIALTANAMVGDKEKCLKAGMDDYLSKPIRPEKLTTMLAKYTAHKERKENNYILAPDEKKQTDNRQDTPIDLAHLELFTDGDLDTEKELLDLFFNEANSSLSCLKQSLADNDDDAWETAAHRLKGASENLGAAPLSKACEEAEDGYKENKTNKKKVLANIETRLNELRKVFN